MNATRKSMQSPPPGKDILPAGLALDDVHHAYGSRPVIEALGFAVAPGEVVCLLGPSGCGKTTTLRLAAGLETLQRGTIAIASELVSTAATTLAPEHRRVGLMFQDFALFPHLNLLDNVGFGLRHLPQIARRAQAMALLERVGLGALASTYPHALSGGEQQRVALVRALAPKPVVMLLDEPFSGLDARLRDQVRDDTLALLKEQGVATLLVTHDAEEALLMADRIALMDKGRLVQLGTPEELYRRPVNAFSAGFFGDLSRFQGRAAGSAVSTPLGLIPCPGLADGTAVEVCVRPEGIKLMAENGPVRGRIAAVRFLGASALLVLDLPGGERVRARCRASSGLAPDREVSFGLDLDCAFVFPSR
ncbi:MAG: ABC transporter ATP-binding protein [Alphaproteobacteria bacterium]|nr:ABC transporter ATP-binding protein [Alphaproteobacteria bacterium]